MEHRIEVRQMFDESFKRKVIEEYLSGKCSKASVLRKYDIRFKGAFNAWMPKLGYVEPKTQKRTFVRIKPESVADDKSRKTSSESKEELLKKIARLEEQLEDEKLRAEMYSRVIDIAEKELKVPLRKKPDTK